MINSNSGEYVCANSVMNLKISSARGKS